MRVRTLHRRTAWLLLAAMLVATLASWAPSSMRGTVPGGLAGLHDVCFTDPSRVPGSDAPAPQASGHCALCALHGAAPPPAAVPVCGLVPPPVSRAAPPPADPLPRSVARWLDAPPRAPPISA